MPTVKLKVRERNSTIRERFAISEDRVKKHSEDMKRERDRWEKSDQFVGLTLDVVVKED